MLLIALLFYSFGSYLTINFYFFTSEENMKKNFKRRDFIKKAGLAGTAAAAVSAFPAPAIAADRVDIAIVATWGRDFPGLGTGAQRFAERLTTLSDGRFNVEYFAAGERVGAFDSFD